MLSTTILVLVVLIALALPIAVVLGGLGLFLDAAYSSFPLHVMLGDIFWLHSVNFILVAIPLFIMMGEIILRSGIAERMYAATAQWLSWLPGGLMHVNITASALFAATSGSSIATAATIGTTALPQWKKRGYNERLFLGSLAAGGTLGILIPPSMNMIVFGFLTNTSVPQLFIAGIIPGLTLSLLYMLVILVACLLRPKWGGDAVPTSWTLRIKTLPDLIPPIALLVVVIGSIYLGWATPTEAAALGVIAALGIAAGHKRLGWRMIGEVMEGTIRTSAMVMMMLTIAFFLNFAIASVGLVKQINEFIIGLGFTPLGTMLFIIGVYLIMGMFMEVLAMVVLTVPIMTPLVVSLGYDPVWFGVLIVILCEAGILTPPVGHWASRRRLHRRRTVRFRSRRDVRLHAGLPRGGALAADAGLPISRWVELA
jgi:tripartite ATP-independent transporter DctM subunit